MKRQYEDDLAKAAEEGAAPDSQNMAR